MAVPKSQVKPVAHFSTSTPWTDGHRRVTFYASDELLSWIEEEMAGPA
jgi:hypothetical protein